MWKTVMAGIAAVSLLAMPASAHSLLKSSVPKHGATVSSARNLTMNFTRPVRLTALKLSAAGKEVPLSRDRSTQASSFSFPMPALGPGKYQIRWTAMATDGHVMSGALSFAVAGKPVAKQPVAPARDARMPRRASV